MNGGIFLVMILFWLLLIGAIVWLVVQLATSGRRGGPVRPWGPMWRGHGTYGPGEGQGTWTQGQYGPGPWGHGPTGHAGESPFEVLDRRLANGEIDVDAYRQLRAALLESRGGQP